MPRWTINVETVEMASPTIIGIHVACQGSRRAALRKALDEAAQVDEEHQDGLTITMPCGNTLGWNEIDKIPDVPEIECPCGAKNHTMIKFESAGGRFLGTPFVIDEVGNRTNMRDLQDAIDRINQRRPREHLRRAREQDIYNIPATWAHELGWTRTQQGGQQDQVTVAEPRVTMQEVERIRRHLEQAQGLMNTPPVVLQTDLGTENHRFYYTTNTMGALNVTIPPITQGPLGAPFVIDEALVQPGVANDVAATPNEAAAPNTQP